MLLKTRGVTKQVSAAVREVRPQTCKCIVTCVAAQPRRPCNEVACLSSSVRPQNVQWHLIRQFMLLCSWQVAENALHCRPSKI
jgi:hypothetical protein